MIDKSFSGVLLFPFGNLSHTSILYYTILYVITAFEWYQTYLNIPYNVIDKVLSDYFLYGRIYM
jgi:hypothetical protein